MNSLRTPCTSLSILFILGTPHFTRGEFIPVPLAARSFNQDLIIERTAPPPLLPVTTASMESGLTNTGLAWYERGYNAAWPASGLPLAGSTVTSDFLTDHEYRFAPDYKTNNVVLIDADLRKGSLTLAEPAAYAKLSFLVSGATGGSLVSPVQVTLWHQNGASQLGTLACPDWMDTARPPALSSFGRVDVGEFTFSSVNRAVPALFALDLAVAESNSPLTRIDFQYLAGTEHSAIFAVSGSPEGNGFVNAIKVSGYNADMIVEASATRRGALSGATTATLESGTGNWGYAWYEQGYYPLIPEGGLPAPSSVLASLSAPDHAYRMPANYSENNAVLLDSAGASAVLAPASPAPYTALSFLGASGQGPAAISCLVAHADGTSETNCFTLPDWLSSEPAAFRLHERVSLGSRGVERLHDSALFGADIKLTNSVSPVAWVGLSLTQGSADTHAAIFALSGAPPGSAPSRPILGLKLSPDGLLKLTSSAPGRLQSSPTLSPAAIWQDEGLISSELLLPGAGGQSRFYRVVSP